MEGIEQLVEVELYEFVGVGMRLSWILAVAELLGALAKPKSQYEGQVQLQAHLTWLVVIPGSHL